jgi:hypothetical protein
MVFIFCLTFLPVLESSGMLDFKCLPEGILCSFSRRGQAGIGVCLPGKRAGWRIEQISRPERRDLRENHEPEAFWSASAKWRKSGGT